MFATLLGALPAPPTPDDDPASGDTALEVVVRAQEAAGLEPITDGRSADAEWAGLAGVAPRPIGDAAEGIVQRWRRTQELTDRAVKQVLLGPWTLLRAGGEAATATTLARVVLELAAAGCQLVEIEERFGAAVDGEADDADRADDVGGAFRTLHAALLDELARHGGEIHLSLSLTGGTPPEAWREAIVGLPYSSLAVDLIHGPDSWNLVTRFPGDRGVIAGALSAGGPAIADAAGEPVEVLQWAASYAASTRGRGPARVGLGSAGSWSNLTWDAALARMQRLGAAARIAAMPPGDAKARQLDPRAVSSRRAALGHDAPPPPRRR
ncbi:MAG TPA: hypothetical protein VM451_09455 [Candidatus Limnocylindria bacterium]|nr:hypothetical protein [Candidatus Limnocylindria bacterium]